MAIEMYVRKGFFVVQLKVKLILTLWTFTTILRGRNISARMVRWMCIHLNIILLCLLVILPLYYNLFLSVKLALISREDTKDHWIIEQYQYNKFVGLFFIIGILSTSKKNKLRKRNANTQT